MHSIKGKIALLSAIILGAGFSVLAPRTSAAQNRRQESRSVQAAPSRHNEGRGIQENSRNSAGERRFNNDMGRWNNNFAEQDRNRGGDRDRGREREHNRGRGDRDRNHLNLGLFWGGTPDYYYPYGYNQAPYGYYGSSSYDVGYSDGFNAGQFDRSQGYLYNPRQYERSGNPEYFEGFVAGYQDGYSQY